MSQTRRRKRSRKFRGSPTHGYGSKKKHRGKGSRGGKGYAGGTKHRKHQLFVTEPHHLGKRGFKSLQQRQIRPAANPINLRDVAKLAAGKAGIDLGALGYTKVIGAGRLAKALTITAPAFSAHAKRKIEAAGGKAVGGASEEAQSSAAS